ncbi:Ppx/GppA phosphatase family protein [Terriglobus sp. TAA 43]|uniref:Ppx/GppA phosphatase family protein n=1 Tax=Terriglobus sp. TAA 43 TaxID=278961 RepID=UPI0006456E10|nr:Ppx/GppA phosphatase family protein [Terriglobus sp. TAA 43]
MPTFAAIDIGSNSCRLAIANVEQHRIKVFHEDREVVRLGESVFETGEISPDAMANTIRALKRFQKAVQAQVVDRVRVVATSAMRDARNAAAFTAWVKSATGWTVEVVSGLEEGRLIHLGVVSGEPDARGKCVMIDLGGGSCEVTFSDNGRIQQMVSLPLGSVRLQQEFLHSDPPTADELRQLHIYIEREMRKLERKLGKPNADAVIATSGAAAALAEASQSTFLTKAKAKVVRVGKKSAAVKRVVRKLSLLEADAASVRKLANRLVKMKNSERMVVPGIGPKRSEIIIGGAFVYASILERLELSGFRYSPLGLRDGILAQMLSDSDERASVHKAVEQERWEGVLQVCRRYNIDLKRADAVRADAVKLFDALERVHGMSPDLRELLAAAAMMNEVGKFMNHQGHHRHAQYIIENSEIFGFSPTERTIMSAIARYLGKSRPDGMDRPLRAVPVEIQADVVRCVVLLRLAIGLNQNRATQPVHVNVRVYPKRVLLELSAAKGGAELEQWSLKKEAPYFREIFRRDLVVELA